MKGTDNLKSHKKTYHQIRYPINASQRNKVVDGDSVKVGYKTKNQILDCRQCSYSVKGVKENKAHMKQVHDITVIMKNKEG